MWNAKFHGRCNELNLCGHPQSVEQALGQSQRIYLLILGFHKLFENRYHLALDFSKHKAGLL